MCRFARPEEFQPSRWRWYDAPAMLLFHRPIRCSKCLQRSYRPMFFAKSPTGLRRPWMVYGAWVAAAVVIMLVLFPRQTIIPLVHRALHIQQRADDGVHLEDDVRPRRTAQTRSASHSR